MADETWVTLRHDETGGTTSVPDVADVIASHEARGWSVVEDEPDVAPFVPPKTDSDEVAEWVDLVHPDLPTGVNRVPNNPGAIQGAFEAGWTYPEPPADAVEDELRQVHPRGGRATKAEREEAERRAAAAAAAATDEPPAVEAAGSNQDEPAGDGAQQKE